MLFFVGDFIVIVVFFCHVLHLDNLFVDYLTAIVLGSGTGFKDTVVDAVKKVDKNTCEEVGKVV